MTFQPIDSNPPIGAISHKDYAGNRLIVFESESERDAYFSANFPTNTKEIYSATLTELVERKMKEALQSKGYPSIDMPHIIVTHSIVTGVSNPRVVRAKKALKWYADIWESIVTHLATIGATTNLDPQTFIDSITPLNLP